MGQTSSQERRNMKIISMAGAKRSGKNTFALYLKEEAESDGKTVELASWAHLLKTVAIKSLGVDDDPESWADRTKERHVIRIIDPHYNMAEHEVSIREFLQNLGTEACRETFGEDFWVDQFWNRFEKVHSKMPDLLIFTDTRFDNEAKSVEHFGGINIEIVKDGLDTSDSHASEQGVSREYIYDTIYNDSDLDALRIKASVAYKRWFGGYLG
jgi:hypothetical protein